MTNTLLVVLCAFAVLSGHLTASLALMYIPQEQYLTPEANPPSPSCGINEQWSDCPLTCGSECPTSEDNVIKRGCASTDPCPEGACECLFNHRRLSNGTCVPVRECPPFDCSRPKERYDPCPPLCPSDDCSQATPDGRCPLPGRIGIVLICSPKCRCIGGFWRKNGVCVPYDQCFISNEN